MSEIVTIMPRKRAFPGLYLAIAAVIMVGVPVIAAEIERGIISHEQARQEVFEAYDGYPDISEARQVQVVGVNCGPGGKELLVRESEEFPVSYIIDNCQNIEVR